MPFLGAVLGPVLGQLTLWLDRTLRLPAAWQYSASTATGVLTVIIGAMVGLLGFVVTISVLVVQMATGTLTFSYSLLRHVEAASVPNVGVTATGLAVAASLLLLLLLYLDRFTHSLRPVAVAALVAGAGRRVVEASPVRSLATTGVADRNSSARTRVRRRWWCGPSVPAPSRRSTVKGWSRSRAGAAARSSSRTPSATS